MAVRRAPAVGSSAKRLAADGQAGAPGVVERATTAVVVAGPAGVVAPGGETALPGVDPADVSAPGAREDDAAPDDGALDDAAVDELWHPASPPASAIEGRASSTTPVRRPRGPPGRAGRGRAGVGRAVSAAGVGSAEGSMVALWSGLAGRGSGGACRTCAGGTGRPATRTTCRGVRSGRSCQRRGRRRRRAPWSAAAAAAAAAAAPAADGVPTPSGCSGTGTARGGLTPSNTQKSGRRLLPAAEIGSARRARARARGVEPATGGDGPPRAGSPIGAPDRPAAAPWGGWGSNPRPRDYETGQSGVGGDRA